MLSYLTADPGRDHRGRSQRRAYRALNRLKLCALERPARSRRVLGFFGRADSRANVAPIETLLRPGSTSRSRAYWDGRGLDGRRRIDAFAAISIATACSAASSAPAICVARALRRRSRRAARRRDRSRSSARSSSASSRRCSTSASCAGWRASPPRSTASAFRPRNIARLPARARTASPAVLKRRVERLACDFPVADNYFAWQAFGRAYARRRGREPAALSAAREFRGGARRAPTACARIMARSPSGSRPSPTQSLDAYVLLDAQDWMNDADADRAVARDPPHRAARRARDLPHRGRRAPAARPRARRHPRRLRATRPSARASLARATARRSMAPSISTMRRVMDARRRRDARRR